MDDKPLDYSTPKHVYVRGRPPIRDQESFQSPIENLETDGKDNFAVESESPFDCDSDDISEDNSTEEENTENLETDDKNNFAVESESHDISEDNSEEETRDNLRNDHCNWVFPAMVVVLASVFCVWLYTVNEVEANNTKNYTIENLANEFPTQVKDFWLSVKVAISEINRAHRPKSVILLYQNDGVHTLDGILKGITSVAVCEITSCSSKPIIIEEGELNTTDILEDYGKIIAKNKEPLQERGVMIIKNLETIPGLSAQAFHSLCDEFNPVVEKALFLFTMKVDSFKNNNIKSIENQLYALWSDLENDKFYPLFTRISDFVLPITNEH